VAVYVAGKHASSSTVLCRRSSSTGSLYHLFSHCACALKPPWSGNGTDSNSAIKAAPEPMNYEALAKLLDEAADRIVALERER
jgi:hypothetical protein